MILTLSLAKRLPKLRIGGLHQKKAPALAEAERFVVIGFVPLPMSDYGGKDAMRPKVCPVSAYWTD